MINTVAVVGIGSGVAAMRQISSKSEHIDVLAFPLITNILVVVTVVAVFIVCRQ